MKTSWIIGLIVVGGVVAFAASASAGQPGSKADDKPDPAGGTMEVRHGIAHDGCAHFELRDQDALRDWAESNALAFAKWLTKLEEVKANPGPAAAEVLGKIFPECQWPPPSSTTFSPQRLTWEQTIANVKAQIAGLDMAAPDGQVGGAPVAILEALMRQLGGSLENGGTAE